jgi:DNA-binding response OmpR family regulator
MRILLVEDDVLMALMAADALMTGEHEVVGPAFSVDDALELAGANLPDLAVVDIDLAGSDAGVGLARELRARFGVHSLFVSAHAATARANRDAALGLLPKPYKLEDLSRSAGYVLALCAGRNPPPSSKPDALEVF